MTLVIFGNSSTSLYCGSWCIHFFYHRILHLLSRDVESDAQESLPVVQRSAAGAGSDPSSRTDRVIELPSPAGAGGDPSSKTNRVNDSGVNLSGSLHGPEGEPLNLASLMEGSTSSALSSPSSENTNSVHINRDEPDIVVTQSPASPATGEFKISLTERLR